MKRYRGTGRFGGLSGGGDEDYNPMEGVANLADVMLVFACGLMLALITYWNVDVGGFAANAAEVQQGVEITDMQGLDDTGNPLDEDAQYEEVGTLYRAPDGTLYAVTKD